VNLKRPILTFNWHEPYLATLAATGHRFTVAEPDLGRNGPRRWNETCRPLPTNVTLVSEREGRALLADGAFDLVLAHNFRDMALVADASAPTILLFHNSLSGELALGGDTVDRDDYLADVTPLAHRATRRVFVSPLKRIDWGIDGDVILPGIDLDLFPLADGPGEPTILRVGNRMRQRAVMFGWETQERIVAGFPSALIGEGGTAATFDQLRHAYRRHRIYLHATVAPYEDGYNLALLEAMASGAAVVALAHPTSPIVDGVDGRVAADIATLRRRIDELMADPAAARRLGAAARNAVTERFPLTRFVDDWNRLIEQTVAVPVGRGA
jgi:hypothetical protein